MTTQEQNILDLLDRSKDGTYNTFIWLGDVYSFLIDCRLNIFRGENDQWAIAAERLGYNPRMGTIVLEVSYYGNCLTNLDEYNNQKTNYYHVHLIDKNSFQNATNDSEGLNENAEFILVRGEHVKLSHDITEYDRAGIILNQFEPNEIRWEEAARLLIIQNRDLFRASDEELYKSIPTDLQKILVLDQWYHRDFELQLHPAISDEHLRQTYEFNKNLTGVDGMDFETFAASFRQQENRNDEWNKEQLNDNRPSSYETWQLLVRVISTRDISLYKPTLIPNTHWTNWEQSGSL